MYNSSAHGHWLFKLAGGAQVCIIILPTDNLKWFKMQLTRVGTKNTRKRVELQCIRLPLPLLNFKNLHSKTKLTTYNWTGSTTVSINVEAASIMVNYKHSTKRISMPKWDLCMLIKTYLWRNGLKVKMKVREVQEVLSTPKIVQRVAEPQGNQKSGPMLLPKVSLKCGLAIQAWKLNLWFRA